MRYVSTKRFVFEYYKLNVRFYNNQRLHASYYSIHIFTHALWHHSQCLDARTGWMVDPFSLSFSPRHHHHHGRRRRHCCRSHRLLPFKYAYKIREIFTFSHAKIKHIYSYSCFLSFFRSLMLSIVARSGNHFHIWTAYFHAMWYINSHSHIFSRFKVARDGWENMKKRWRQRPKRAYITWTEWRIEMEWEKWSTQQKTSYNVTRRCTKWKNKSFASLLLFFPPILDWLRWCAHLTMTTIQTITCSFQNQDLWLKMSLRLISVSGIVTVFRRHCHHR